MNQYVIALGMFDGVHLGHRELLKRASEIAKTSSDTSVVFTYTNHPRELFFGSFDYLTPIGQRTSLYKQLGMDCIDAVPFTMEFANQTPDEFLHWLLDRYDHSIRCIVCGYDYRFGNRATGDTFTLQDAGRKMGFDTEIVPPVYYADEPCSSTRVREAVRNGELETVTGMLDRPYAIDGIVIHNKAIGRRIGFPTANIDPGHQLLPKDGVYATALRAEGKIYAAVTNIGNNPTVGGEKRTIETHVPDADLDLYERDVTVFFLKRLRNEIAFSDINDLIMQISSDILKAKKVYKDNEKSVYKSQNL